MGAPELLALSLGVSVVVAALGWAGGRVVELLTADPRVRDGVWAAALILPALPPLAVGLLLLTPAPVREIAAAPAALATELAMAPVGFVAAPPSADLAFDATGIAWALLGVALLLSLGRVAALVLRVRRLVRLLARTETPGPAIREMVENAARDLAIRPPLVRISATAPEALLASLGRARMVLPADLVAPSADPAAIRAVIAHELSHLKRGDHRALWLEESLLALLAANPLMPVLRARRAAVREEACDALALAGATPETRRAYARSLIEALRSRAASQAPGLTPALTFTGAGRTSAMNRLKAVMTPAAPAGRRARLIAVAFGLAVTVAAGGATVALAGQRAVEVRVASAPEPDPAADGAGAAARAAAQAALAALPPETRGRFQNASAADYRAYCASADAAEEGFCAGVMFSHLGRAPGNGLCMPESSRGEQAQLTHFIARGKAEIARLAPRRDEGVYEYSERALKTAYPCGAEVATSAASDLTVRISRSSEPFILGSSNLLRVTLQSQDGERGARNITMVEIPIAPDLPLEREVRFSLKDEQLPTLTRGRTYDLTAEIRDADGRVFYAAEPIIVRMAAGSRGRLAKMRPELVLARAAAVPTPAVSPRAYQARLTITDNGQPVANGRLRLVPGDGAVTVLNADGREYRFNLSLEDSARDPHGEGRLTVRADVGRAAEAGGWEPEAKPALLMRPDGTARMSWGNKAGLLFEILVEPA